MLLPKTQSPFPQDPSIRLSPSHVTLSPLTASTHANPRHGRNSDELPVTHVGELDLIPAFLALFDACEWTSKYKFCLALLTYNLTKLEMEKLSLFNLYFPNDFLEIFLVLFLWRVKKQNIHNKNLPFIFAPRMPLTVWVRLGWVQKQEAPLPQVAGTQVFGSSLAVSQGSHIH